ncbi:MAG TPA: cell division protein ZapB [Bryobacteraceae bacterium]|jgi:chromosome segregation ATPase|nr:cell division protein ZapB [Bryobacteraceae bacterium]
MATSTSVPVTEDTDSLASLEERINRAVQLVSQLRREKEGLEKHITSLEAEKTAVEEQVIELQARNESLTEEISGLRSERKQVRTRIEKLLGQMDLLSAS